MRRFLIGLFSCMLLATSATAATLKLRDGTRVECKVRSYDPATQTLHVTTADGKETSYTMAQLDGRSVYVVNASLIPADDANAQLLAANFARDAGLYAHARRRYDIVVDLDPSMEAAVEVERQKLRRVAADACMKNAQAAIAKKDVAEAEKWLTILVEKLPAEPEAATARTMLDEYYGKMRSQQMAEVDEKASEALKKDAANGRKRFDAMLEKSRQGLQAKSSSQAEKFYRGALSDGEFVLKELDSLERKYKTEDVAVRAEEYRGIVNQQLVTIRLHLASQLATQSDYKGAQREVNKALAIDPKNAEALAMRARIEDYSSNGIRWRWSS